MLWRQFSRILLSHPARCQFENYVVIIRDQVLEGQIFGIGFWVKGQDRRRHLYKADNDVNNQETIYNCVV